MVDDISELVENVVTAMKEVPYSLDGKSFNREIASAAIKATLEELDRYQASQFVTIGFDADFQELLRGFTSHHGISIKEV